MNNQTVRRNDTKHSTKLEIHIPDKKPSWLRYGSGHAHFALESYHPSNIAFSACEFNAETGRAREVMFSFDRVSAKAIRDYLNEVLA